MIKNLLIKRLVLIRVIREADKAMETMIIILKDPTLKVSSSNQQQTASLKLILKILISEF
jgi:hypothetical protein